MIKIIDNFFDKNILKKIQNHIISNVYYTPRWYEGKEKTKENYYGLRFRLNNDPELEEIFVKQTENKFKIKIKKLDPDSGIDKRNLNKFYPHIDDGLKINILIMLYGPVAVTNGTVFYNGTPEKCELDIHVGFRPNRAILFPSNWVHSYHASNLPNLQRYTSTLFIEDYEDV